MGKWHFSVNFLILFIMKTKRRNFRYPFIATGKIDMLRNILSVVLASILLTAISCSKDESNPNVTFSATINGASETPANASTATGTATLTYNKDTKIFDIVVNYTGITATNAHIHKAAVGVPGGVVFGFTQPITSPINYTSPVLTESQDSALNANLYYVNIHSAEFPGGEIRGQLIKQ
jgi:hypothetical protein